MLKLQGKVVRSFTQSFIHLPCSSVVPKVIPSGYTICCSHLASHGTSKVTYTMASTVMRPLLQTPSDA